MEIKVRFVSRNLSAFLLTLFSAVALIRADQVCPPCVKYHNPLPNHLIGFEIDSYNCMCEQLLTRCAIVHPVCPAGQQCVLRKIPTCTFPPCNLDSAVCEPFTRCPPVSCDNSCDRSGYMLDPNNCQTCVCQDPCKEMTCRQDEKCVRYVEAGGGHTGRCVEKQPCPPCVASRNYMPTNAIGIEINADGCRCHHNLTRCSKIEHVCPRGMQCVLKPISQCTFRPCRPESAACVPFTRCPAFSCTTTCSVSGFFQDQNGCPICACNEPCREMTCPFSKKCVVVHDVEKGKYARCDPKKACPPCVKFPNPMTHHVNGIEINSDGCRCSHNLTKCSPVEPVCPTGRQCVLKQISRCTFPPCKLVSAVCEPFTGCPRVRCSEACSNSGYILDPNGCQTCTCKDPCQEINCPRGQVCYTILEVGGGQTAECNTE